MTTLPQTTPMRIARPVATTHLAIPGPALAMGMPAQNSNALSAADIWRVIRSHLWLIIISVMLAVVAGYFANDYLAKHYSKYRTRGLMLVQSAIELPLPGGEPRQAGQQEIEIAQRTQVAQLTHESLFLQLMQDPETKVRQTAWYRRFATQKDPLAAARKDLDDNFVATPLVGSRLVAVEMTCADPKDTKVIVEELVNRHIQNVVDEQRKIEEKKAELLKRQRDTITTELTEDVIKQLRQKETELGGEQVGTFANYNAKELQLNRLLEERSRIAAEQAGYESRYNMMVKDLEEGKTPAEVEVQINNSGRYLQARERVDTLDIDLDAMITRLGEHHETVIFYKQRRALLQQKLDETREELKSNYAETMKSMLMNYITAAHANGGRVDESVLSISKDLGRLNQTMNDYRVLQTRELDLRTRQRELNNKIMEITQFKIASPWSEASWASRPQVPDAPSFPKLPVSLALAVLAGLAFSLGIAFLREMTDTTVRSPRDIERVGQLRLLGMIPHEADDPQLEGARLPLAIFDAPHSAVAEQFRQVRTRLHHAASMDTIRSFLVTSASPGDGKTTVAANLAAGLALNGRRILLVDSNFRRPQLHTVFGVGNDTGFGEVLNNPDAMETAILETEIPNLNLLTTGPRPANATELLESPLLSDFIERALEHYDHVIFDGGPLLVVSEAIALAPRVDGVVTVARARGNSRGLLVRMREELRRLKAENLGVILNGVRSQGGGYYGRNIKTYYAYQDK